MHNIEVTSANRIGQRILVIDDERRMADSVQTLLAGNGYEVDAAYGGQEGIRRLAERDYQLVITDLRMADKDGFEVMRAIGDRRNVGFIIITGHASTETAIEALHHRVFDYLTKPFDFDVLRSAVERALDRLEAERFRDDMISMITHDIKIPLSSIIGYSSLIFDKQSGALNARAPEFVQTINSNGLKILSLIDNFLTTCRIEAGRLGIFPREVNLRYILEDLISVFQADLERSMITLETHIPDSLPAIPGDENLLFRAMGNVLSNACKFAPKEGRVILEAKVVDSDESPLGELSACVSISNNGPAILPEEQELIFEKYRRARIHEGFEGSGIGLYVVRYIIEAHNGTVKVSSLPNSLTTFSIYLPITGPNTKQEGVSQT